ncbi:alpha/beta hydrolase [Romboutsia weinsteinii]|uniref:Alpha/beta hydrolase n=1 Tax=Romboutsia weinsteinii TaxID=2020949 RepID=A0A371J2Y7_9FIRM|nr:alpha/beta hydrolase [Romboutsia weinsteinii]RDY27161.1 alpha/beta hydrolase [Romboutsia weinsteinii]
MKFKKLCTSLTIIVLLASTITGCSKNESSSNPIDISYNIDAIKDSEKEIVVNKFNLGSSTIKERGKEIPFEIEGLIGAPKDLKDNTPVVFLFHGQHGTESKADFEDGFEYIVEKFAKNGIIAISVDDQVNHTWEYGEAVENERIKVVMQTHLDNLMKANKGENIDYGVDLKRKVNFDNVGLVGHSVGGEGVLKLALDQQKKGFNGIKAILSLAPAYNEFLTEFPDVPTAILVSEYDGDVKQAGAELYQDIMAKSNRKTPIALSYLIGGNHNSYNTVVENNREFNAPDKTNGGYPEKLTNKQQQEFTMNYTVDFIGSILKDEQPSLFDSNNPTPNTMYGYKVLNVVEDLETETIFGPKQFKDISANKVEVKEVVESAYSEEDDSIGVFNDIQRHEKLQLLKLDWKEKNTSVKLNVSDLSKLKSSDIAGLNFKWALDSTSELNSKDKNTSLTVTVVDNKNKKASIKLGSDTAALKYIEGEVVINEYLEGVFHNYWSRPTPITDTFIPTSKLENVDLSNIDKIIINFDEVDRGSIVLQDVSVAKK